MAKKKTTVRGKRGANPRTGAAKTRGRAAKPRATEHARPSRRPRRERGERETSERGEEEHRVPIEHYRGERNRPQILEAGSLDEETLDRDAPFNKTYGR
jgi:hypothetical protein